LPKVVCAALRTKGRRRGISGLETRRQCHQQLSSVSRIQNLEFVIDRCRCRGARALCALVVVAPLLGGPSAARAGDSVWQYSTIAALTAGGYNGDLTAGELKTHGDFGLGTFNALNGEMIVLGGQIWQVPASGRPALVADTVRVPFAAVMRFEPHPKIAVPAGLDLTALSALLDTRIGDLGLIQVVRIDGRFPQLKARSVKPQTPPYQPLSEVLARDQVVFDLVNVHGTLVGFRFPACFSGVNAPGWHFHFLAADRRSGGHVLDLVTGPSRAMLVDGF
jgi:acetolactate decarboxylase